MWYDKFIKAVLIGGCAAALAIGLYYTMPQYLRSRDLERERAQILREIAEKEREIADLKEMQRRFREDPEFVEAIARRQRRIFPGGLVFVFDR